MPLPSAPTGVMWGGAPPPASGEHVYFDSLVARPDHWKSYSLRDVAQIAMYRGGSAAYADYLFATDPDPRKQDAMKLSVPTYTWGGHLLAVPMTATDTAFTAPAGLVLNPQVYYRMDSEEMVFASRVGQIVTVTRGVNGTTPAAHAVGTQIYKGTNSLPSQVRLPLGTSLGSTYMFTWDSWMGAEFKTNISGLTAYKHFQHARTKTGDGSIALEVRSIFGTAGLAADEVAAIDLRQYGTLGPGVTLVGDSVRPRANTFNIKADTWTRYWVVVEHVIGDWDRFSLWVADPTREPVQIYDRIPLELNAATGVQTLVKFWYELNTSLDVIKAGRPTLVSYVRNFVALLNPVNAPMTRP